LAGSSEVEGPFATSFSMNGGLRWLFH